MSLLKKYQKFTKDDWKQIERAKEEMVNSSEFREYTAREIQDFLAADRLDAQTADKVSRLLGQAH
jgi:hypothetical protein